MVFLIGVYLSSVLGQRSLSTTVSSQSTLVAALSSGASLYFQNDISITSVISIESMTNVEIDAQGYTLTGATSVQCFYMTSSTVTLKNMIVTNCHGTNVCI